MHWFGKNKLEERVKELEIKVDNILKQLVQSSTIQSNTNTTPLSDTKKPVNYEPKTIPIPIGVVSAERVRLTADLEKLCGLINSKLQSDNLTNPVCIEKGLGLISISHSLQQYGKTADIIDTNFDFIVAYMLRNINMCTAIRSSSKTEGNFDILLTRTGGDIRINTSKTNNRSHHDDPDFVIMLSKD